ncbi:MAG TPA: cytochrome c biogenesis protein CcdA [Anaerolineales bacterium]
MLVKQPLLWAVLGLTLIAGLVVSLDPVQAGLVQAKTATEGVTHIFFSAGCADCWPYVEEVLLPKLQSHGLASQAEIHDYTVPAERALLLQVADGVDLPRSIADSLYTFVPTQRGMLVVLGHVPPELVSAAIESPERPQTLVIWQPEMHGAPTEYRLWSWSGEVQTFAIDTPFSEALAQTTNASGPLPAGLANLSELLPAVVITGLLDSVNPCAFAVILLLLAFLFTLRQSRGRVLQLGFVYIGMIFLVYFTIGLGILRAVRFSDDPHFVARAGAWLLVGLGSINLIEYFFPRFPIKLHMPRFAGERTNQLIKQATFPATIGAGLLVGLCTFPCSGGIYVSIITLLNAKTTLGWGLGYLGLYNLLFVLPLVIILLAAGNRATARAWARWERSHALNIRLWYGLAMVALGAVMLLWVIG